MTLPGVYKELKAEIAALRRRFGASLSTVTGGVTELTGDGTAGPGSGSQPFTLANSGVTPGTYGDASHIPIVTFDAKGRATFADEIPTTSLAVGSWVPLASGAEPLTFISDGAGTPILVFYTP